MYTPDRSRNLWSVVQVIVSPLSKVNSQSLFTSPALNTPSLASPGLKVPSGRQE